ncbi:205 kDa microtubule-associated protein [Drosophila ficusphila]|uniref:205 kDa microtubule-associated protein n=1 Tax=Drosophila ficusphila TaxID=30025 RepID=UPI0007E6F7D5|nr:205 kDa microtubule-associated protein [Drosophila ficusphila]
MEQHEDNAQFDYYLQNRLTESLQITGGAGEHHLHIADSAGEELSATSKSEQRDADGDKDEDEEWKYIHEVQQSEKLQEQHEPTQEAGNGFNRPSEDQILGHVAATSLSPVCEKENVEVIKNDCDLSTNSYTTISTGDVLAQDQSQEAEQMVRQNLQSQNLHQEDEDEPSSVATTYGTSSLSDNNPTPLDQDQEEVVLFGQSVTEKVVDVFENKENHDPIKELEENHSQLNPNAVAFVPSFGSQPSSPLPDEEPLLGMHPRQLLACGPMDDLVAESPRKGSAKDNMDSIAVPDERDFDIEADKRPHELEQDSDLFGAGTLEMQLLNGSGSCDPAAVHDTLDHGPETSVDMDLSLDQLTVSGDIMRQSIYAEHNASIEDILNSVQPLPTQTGDEKELLHVEEKEHVSQSPSTEELQFQQEFQHERQFFHNADQNPMQASFYLEHTSKEAQKDGQLESEQDPVGCSNNFSDQSLLLDTSAPQFSPKSDSPVPKLEQESLLADQRDIAPSPFSSTEEKHLVENTKELDQNQEVQVLEPFSAGAPPQMEEYAAINAVPDSVACINVEVSTAPNGVNPFAQPFTPGHLAEEHLKEELDHRHPDQLVANLNEPELLENLVEENCMGKSDFASKSFEDKCIDNMEQELLAKGDFLTEEQKNNSQGEQLLHAVEDRVFQEDQLATVEENIVEDIVPIKEEQNALEKLEVSADLEQQELSSALEEKVSPDVLENVLLSSASDKQNLGVVEETVLSSTEPLVEGISTTKKEEDVSSTLAEVAAVAAAGVAVAGAIKSKSIAKSKLVGAPSAVKKPTTSSTTTSVAAATKAAVARPRTAPVATKSSSTTLKSSSAAPPTATTRKPLNSNAASTLKPAPKLSCTRPSTAPAGKVAPVAKTLANKSNVNGTASGSGSGIGTVRNTTARKPAASGIGLGTGAGSTVRRPATNSSGTGSTLNSAAPTKPRLGPATTTLTKPKPLSPRSTTSTTSSVRKVPSAPSTSLSIRSPSKPATNTLGKSTISTTNVTTTTKTFTARPAPKFTHSSNVSNSNGSSTRRLLVPSSSNTTSAAPRKSSPSKASPVKAASKPLTPKPKENGTSKPSPVGFKSRKSTPLQRGTPAKAPGMGQPNETSLTANAGINAEDGVNQNGSDLHDLVGANPVPEQPVNEQIVASQKAEESLLDF